MQVAVRAKVLRQYKATRSEPRQAPKQSSDFGLLMIHRVVRLAAPNFPVDDAIGLSPKDKRCVP